MKRRILTTSFCILILCGAVLAALSITGTRQQLTLTEIINARRDPHIEALLDGDTDKARKIQLENLNLINALFCETNPVPVKALMNMKGMNVGGCRLPLGPLCGASRRVLRNLADSLELPR